MDRFDQEGNLTDMPTRDRIIGLLQNLVDSAQAHRTEMKQAKRPRVVIVGGGFGGLYAARALAGAPVSVTLIDKRNNHLFRPLLYQGRYWVTFGRRNFHSGPFSVVKTTSTFFWAK
jgi:outer membrane receptor protein involved in Fe transport